MRAVRFGSYSIVATRAGMPNLSRLKSMRRYCRLCPPLIYRLVMWPLLLRPPVRRSGSSSVFSGSVLVISEKSETERKRVAGVIGRNCRMPILALEHLNSVALFEGDDCLFPGRPATLITAIGAPLGPHDHRADAGDRHLEQRFDRRFDLRLRRVVVHAERVLLARAVRRGRLLGDDRPDDSIVQLRHRGGSPP